MYENPIFDPLLGLSPDKGSHVGFFLHRSIWSLDNGVTDNKYDDTIGTIIAIIGTVPSLINN